MVDIKHTVLDVANATVSGEGGVHNTLAADSGMHIAPKFHDHTAASFYLHINELTGTNPTVDVSVVTTVDNEDYTLGEFKKERSVSSTRIIVPNCPGELKIIYILGGIVTNFTATVICMRNHCN